MGFPFIYSTMATYDIKAHGLLSEGAKDIRDNNPDGFEAHVIGAEFVFGLNATSYTGDKKTLAELILVYQVNFQVENDQESEVYDRIEEGERVWQFKDRIPISPTAEHLAKQLVENDKVEKQELQRRGASGNKSGVVVW